MGVVNVDEIITPDDRGRIMFHYVLATVLMGQCSGTPRASSDALDVRYFRLGEALARDDVAASTVGFLKKMASGAAPVERPIAVENSRQTALSSGGWPPAQGPSGAS